MKEEYCIYLRKSRADFEAEQHGEGETLSTHKKTLLALAKRLNLPVTEIYQEIVSGDTIAARPEMQRLLDDVNDRRWAGVLVMEVERLARGDTMDQGLVAQSFKYSGTKIITPLKTYDPSDEFDEEYFEFGLFMSRREYKTINRRLQRGREAAARAGKWQSQAPYGYKKKKLEHDKGWTLEIDPEVCENVRMMYDWYVNGAEQNGETRRLGIQAIARRLNEMGIPSCRHDYWQKETVRDIISNPAYAGLVRWGYRKTTKKIVDGKPIKSRPITDENCIIAEGLHEGIISRELFDKAQEILAGESAKQPVRYDLAAKSPLSGLVICAKCGRKMVLRKASAANKPDYLVCHAKSCDMVSAPLRYAETALLEIISGWVAEYGLEAKSKQKQSRSDLPARRKALAALEKEIGTLESQMKRACALLEQGIYTTEVFLMRSKELTDEIADKKKKAREAADAIEEYSRRLTVRDEFIPTVRRVVEAYDTMSAPADKNALLRQIVSHAVYNKKHSGAFKGHSADDFELSVFPIVPFR